MKTGSIISYILAGIAIILSFLFILGSFSPNGSPSWLFVGIIGLLIGFALIFAGARLTSKPKPLKPTTLNVNLPGNVQLDTIKCQSWARPGFEDIGSSWCPHGQCHSCGTVYQLTEEPKW